MVLTLIGLGLFDASDITLRGLEAVRQAEFVYLEAFTSILHSSKEDLEQLYGKAVTIADRKLIEEGGDCIIDRAKAHNVALLVVGDPLCATTHTDLILRAKRRGVRVDIVNNASIANAAAICGMQLYRFGEIVSIPFFEPNWQPDSFYDKIVNNKKSNLHTLCLLDIKVKEQTFENMMKGNEIFESPKFMTISDAISQLLLIEEKRNERVCGRDSKAFGLARIGSQDEIILSGTLTELRHRDFGAPLHSLVVVSPELHDMELEFFKLYNQP